MFEKINNRVKSGLKSINDINHTVIQQTTQMEESILKHLSIFNKIRLRRTAGLFGLALFSAIIFRDQINNYLGKQASVVVNISMEDQKLKDNLKIYLEAMLTDETLKKQTQAVLTDVVKRTFEDPEVIKAGEDYLVTVFTSKTVIDQINQSTIDVVNNQDVQTKASDVLSGVIKNSIWNIFKFK
jgi:hypothetical protein